MGFHGVLARMLMDFGWFRLGNRHVNVLFEVTWRPAAAKPPAAPVVAPAPLPPPIDELGIEE